MEGRRYAESRNKTLATDIGKGSENTASVKEDQLCYTELEEVVVKYIEKTTEIGNPKEVWNAGIWMKVKLPAIRELNRADENP